jgi:predicted dehydrogenase
MVRVAILGNGAKVALHREAWGRVPGIEVVAEAEAEVVDVCLPPGQVAEGVAAAARAGREVLVEYLPGDLPEGVTVSLLRPERWQPLARDMKATLDAGKLGALRYAHAASIWQGTPEAAGDPGAFLIEQATGTLDFVRSLFDVPVAKVFARDCPLEGAEAGSWYVSVVVFFADASQAICEVGLTSSFAANTGLQRLALTGMRGSAYYTERDADVVVGGSGVRPLIEEPVEGVAAALTDWLAKRGEGNHEILADGKKTLRLVQAAAESVRTGQPIAVGV